MYGCTTPSPLVEREMEGEVDCLIFIQRKNLEVLMFGYGRLYRSLSTCGEGDGG